jgi:hypothetical protein
MGQYRCTIIPMIYGYAASDGLSLTKNFMRIKVTKLRRRIVDLVEQIAVRY